MPSLYKQEVFQAAPATTMIHKCTTNVKKHWKLFPLLSIAVIFLHVPFSKEVNFAAGTTMISSSSIPTTLPFSSTTADIGKRRTLHASSSSVKPLDDNFPYGKVEQIIPTNERKKSSEIRYAAFGSSVSWGAALKNREEEAYIWKLSKEHGVNYAIRSSGPNYPKSCLFTMMGDEEYDVIILEYFMHAREGLKSLAKRVRDRFPDAIIIILRLWYPIQFQNKGIECPNCTGRGHYELLEFVRTRGFGPTASDYIHNPEFHKAISQTPDVWAMPERFDVLFQLQDETANEIGAYMVKMPFTLRRDGPGGWLDIGDKLLAQDSFHLGPMGHEDIANQVQAIVDRVGVPKNMRVNKFSHIDQCYNWFQTGEIGPGLTFGSNGKVATMPNTQKYVLSFDGGNGNDEKESWFEIDNQNDGEMELFVGYMTTGPAPSKYPMVEAIRENGERYLLDPNARGWNKPVHVSALVNLGRVAPHFRARVSFKSLELTEWPFRMIQLMVTPPIVTRDEMLFDSGESIRPIQELQKNVN